MKKFLFKGKKFDSLYEVRQASGSLFSATPTDEDLRELGIEVVSIEPTPEEITTAEKFKAKAQRAETIAKATVEVDGMVFNADLTAIQLMSATLSIAMANKVDFKTTKLPWVLAEDKWTEVTIETLAKVAMQAGLSLANEWVKPYPHK